MPPTLALFLGIAFILGAFRSFRSRGELSSAALIWPTIWYLVVATRPFGVWMSTWGVPLAAGGGDGVGDGSFVDRWFYATLTVIGLWILFRRGFDWGGTLRRNPWLTFLFALMAVSILWSQYPYISFKRYIKFLGSVAMALVVLTDRNPFESMLTVLRRCLYIHLPMSIICIKYYRDLGVSYDWDGTAVMWQGLSTSKNTLGQVAMLGVMYFYWDLRKHWSRFGWKSIHVLYLLMALYLLKGSSQTVSLTSVAVCAFALAIFVRIQTLRLRPQAVRRFVTTAYLATLALVTLVLAHSVVVFSSDSLFGYIITKFGRDITLTDRLYIWTDMYAAVADSRWLGLGFGSFWIERMANIPWNATMTWVLGQGHNGYIDTYLHLGIAGGLALSMVLFTTLPRLLDSLGQNFDFGCFRIALFLTIIFVNMTETTFLRGDHHLWFLMLLVLWQVAQPDRISRHNSIETLETPKASPRPVPSF